MSAEFIDTNVLVYAHDRSAGSKQSQADALLRRLWNSGDGALSTQVLAEFFSVTTRELKLDRAEAVRVVSEMGLWRVHQLSHRSLTEALELQSRHQTSWWDALILQSALELDCSILWSEDLPPRRLPGGLKIRNPFA